MKKMLYLIITLALLTSVTALEFPPGAMKVIEYEKNVGLAVTFLIALLGGLLTFTSPCGFVVIPAFFSYVFKERKKALCMTALFSAGMTVAFIIFGIIAGLVGNFFNQYKEFFSVVAGVLLIVFGIMMILNKGFSLFDFRIKHKPNHTWEIFFLGFFFAVGWTPCIGPILAGVIVLSATAGSVAKSVLLFGAYALGVALPLMIVAYLSDKYDVSKWFTSRHIQFTLFGRKIYTHLYGIIGGVILILIGAIMLAFKGTRVFMVEIPKYINWRMNFFTEMNEYLVQSKFFTSTTANIAGILIVLALLYAMYRAVWHHKK